MAGLAFIAADHLLALCALGLRLFRQRVGEMVDEL